MDSGDFLIYVLVVLALANHAKARGEHVTTSTENCEPEKPSISIGVGVKTEWTMNMSFQL